LKHTLSQLARYAVVGLASNGFGYFLYLLLTQLGLGPKTAMSLLYIVGVVQTFIFNKRWTFKNKNADHSIFLRYCMSYGLGYIINLIVLFILVDRQGYPHQIIQGAMILMLAIMLFLLQKFWVFRSKDVTALVHQQK
jgi:putative flippase GtrA